MSSVHFSSQRMDWKTPKAVYQILDSEFHFDHDPCPPNFTVDGLASEWGISNFVNPPYGRELPKFVAKAYEEWQKGKTVVLLIPSRTDTRWWHDYCMNATEIRFIKGRLKFDDQANSAPFPSVIVIFKVRRNNMNKIIIDGVEYYQPECKCVTGAGHICYLRPTPQVINAPIEQILKSLDGSHVSE